MKNNYKVGDRVEIEYNSVSGIGTIYSIYNNGETVNVKLSKQQGGGIAPFFIGSINPEIVYIVRKGNKIILKL